jgi:hypothetical protein
MPNELEFKGVYKVDTLTCDITQETICMRLVRYGERRVEKPGIISKGGRGRALHPVIRDLEIDVLTPEAQAIIASRVERLLLASQGTMRRGCPIANIRQIVAVGLNCRDHAKEAGLAPADVLLLAPPPVQPIHHCLILWQLHYAEIGLLSAAFP